MTYAHCDMSISAFETHCCHMGTAIKHPVPDRVKLSFVIFDTRHSDPQSGTGCFHSIWQQWASKE